MGAALAMNPAELLLSRLEGVKAYGRGHRALCPACGGKAKKLSITEADNGAVLLHCFAGCDALAIVEAVGLRLGDLFPIRLAPMTEAERREAKRRMQESGWRAALDVLAVEAAIVQIAGRQMTKGNALNDEDGKRLSVAVERIGECRQVLCEERRFRPEVHS